ncbi:XK-related protein 7 [Pygocentrus nattereri]|uniref:XK-related protein n=1 Tax=Pygocentrus nattereri TaxID=42514 RepID=A0A3B4CH07_PYGNA|nr:XK-related protein 7 [Pygocentrus nattereri]
MAAKSDGAAACVAELERERESREDVENRESARAGRSPLLDCCWVVCALLVFFSDAATDLWLAADYYARRDYWWFALTLVFVAVPSAVVQVLSFRWFVYDYTEMEETEDRREEQEATDEGGDCHLGGGSKGGAGGGGGGGGGSAARSTSRTLRCCRACMWLFQSVVHILQLGQVWRYVHTLYLGMQSWWHTEPVRRHCYWRLMFETADINMLRLLEAFLKSAPQLVLQLSIMIHSRHILPLQGLSASASLVSLAWMIASYQKVLRDSRDDKLPMSYKAVIVQMLWHLFTIGARTIAFALFASVFQLYFGIFIVAHWCAMTFWIIQGETDFCMSKWEEIIYNMVVGIIYIFCWFNVKEGPARFRLGVYYCVILVENAALTGAWYVYRGPHTSDFYALIIVCVVVCSYALGTFFMFVYYCLLHPDGPILGTQWSCVEEGMGVIGLGGMGDLGTPLPQPDVVTSPPRTLQRTTGGERESGVGDRDSCLPVFQVRPPSVPPVPSPRTPKTEGPVIRIDLPRKNYPAWDAHFIDRRLRKTILVLENTSPVTPRIQYRSLSNPKEVTEYETTV